MIGQHTGSNRWSTPAHRAGEDRQTVADAARGKGLGSWWAATRRRLAAPGPVTARLKRAHESLDQAAKRLQPGPQREKP